jgi:hypothetical protein
MKMTIRSTSALLLAAFVLLLVQGCQQSTVRAPPDLAGAAAWDDYVAALLESQFEADRQPPCGPGGTNSTGGCPT